MPANSESVTWQAVKFLIAGFCQVSGCSLSSKRTANLRIFVTSVVTSIVSVTQPLVPNTPAATHALELVLLAFCHLMYQCLSEWLAITHWSTTYHNSAHRIRPYNARHHHKLAMLGCTCLLAYIETKHCYYSCYKPWLVWLKERKYT